MKNFDFAAGEVLLIDKPLTWTSFDVVNKLRFATKCKKIGHAGTLDPLATGLLIICTGKKTKEIDRFQGLEKEYTGKMVLGRTTPSIDLETDFDSETSIDHLQVADLEALIPQFVGVIEQTPPIYSAIKINGKPAYLAARKGKELEIKPKTIEIKTLALKANFPEVSFRVVCSKGTYIRSLVRDIGQILGVGAYLAELRRTRIGEFSVADAYTLPVLVEELAEKSTFL